MSWTDERVELLKKLWQDGLSASQIAAELGGIDLRKEVPDALIAEFRRAVEQFKADLPAVLAKAAARADVLRTLKGSAQVEVAGADHYFAGSEPQLVKQIRQFLDRQLR